MSTAGVKNEECDVAVEILLIDRDASAIEHVKPVLERDGYRVTDAVPSPAAIRKTLSSDLRLVLLGMNSQEEDWHFCRRLLTYLEVPLVLLLASDDELDRARALDLGADDCMLKPVALVELIARVRAVLRWSKGTSPRRQYGYFVDGELVVDLTRREVRIDDEPVALTPTEFQLLAHFIRHTGEVLSPDWLLQQMWSANPQRRSSCIKQHVYHLRQKLEPDPTQPRRLVTQWGKGYVFQAAAVEQG
jgi:DNA-binding response OmpR family regulator